MIRKGDLQEWLQKGAFRSCITHATGYLSVLSDRKTFIEHLLLLFMRPYNDINLYLYL